MRLLTASLLLAVSSCIAAQQPADLSIEPRPNLLLASSSSSAAASTSGQQQSPQQSSPDAPQPQTTDVHAQADRELKQQESQRMLGIVPAFNEVIGGHAAPLSPRQKFSLFFHSAFDPYQFGIVALDAGLEQWENEYPEYHQGAAGYARRYGAAFADNFDGNFWGNAVLPSVLHQDPRYYRRGHGKAMHRILYAASMSVICKGDNGHWQANVSNISGNLIAGGISNLYYPASDRGIGLTFQRGLTVTATGAIGSEAEEFYPDLAAYFSRRHARKLAAKAAATQQSTATPRTH